MKYEPMGPWDHFPEDLPAHAPDPFDPEPDTDAGAPDPENEPLLDGTQANFDDDLSDQDEDILADVPDHPRLIHSHSRSAATAKAKPNIKPKSRPKAEPKPKLQTPTTTENTCVLCPMDRGHNQGG
mmetsp:Transcript_123545/g.214279  ORF Transcript_123545/g.214279 Transcript_123545/m.214279 type:complete len:126 (-) Transcript_123545:920-1297(-)